jgi:hypothetical protein
MTTRTLSASLYNQQLEINRISVNDDWQESLHALAVYARNISSFRGPYIGHVRIAQKNERNFSEEQLAQANAAPTLLAMGGLEVCPYQICFHST